MSPRRCWRYCSGAGACARTSRTWPSAACAALGLAARYVSGYLETLPPPGKAKLQSAPTPRTPGSQVYLPGAGWHDCDPTNNLQPSGRHITTAWGRDYSDVTPLQGVIYGGGDTHRIEVEVDVTALPEPVEL